MEWLTLLNSKCLSSKHTGGQGRRIAAGFWGQLGLSRENMAQKEKRNREIHIARIKAKITNAASTVEAEKGRFLGSRPENTCLIKKKKKKVQSWRGGSVVSSTGYPSSGPELGSRHLYVSQGARIWCPLLDSIATRHSCGIQSDMKTKHLYK